MQRVDKPGDRFLAETFQVQAWSPEFVEILFTISKRCEVVIDLVQRLPLDEDLRADAVAHVREIAAAFNLNGLQTPWNSHGCKRLARENVQPLKMLSATVRQIQAYPKPTPEDIENALADIDLLLEWLSEHQLQESDSIRQALIEGLKLFRFRLQTLGWVGWGHAMDSLREVVAAYFALEHSINITPDTNAEAMLRKISAGLKSISAKIGVAQGVYDKGKFLLEIYGAARAVGDVTSLFGGFLPSP
jgi:hypothetical protein